MKNNALNDKFYWLYRLGFFIILTLPIISFTPLFYPPSWTKATVLKIIVVLMLDILLYQVLFKHKKIDLTSVKKNHIFWAFAIFYIVFLASSIFSVDPYLSFWGNPERGEGFINLIFYGLFALTAFLVIKKEDWEKVWIFSLGLATTISMISILAFYEFSYPLLAGFNPRTGSTIGNAIPFGIYLAMLLFVAIPLFLSEKKAIKKIFYGFAFFTMLFTLFLTGSRGAYAGFLAGVFYFLIFYPVVNNNFRKFSRILRMAAITLLAVVVATVMYATYAPNITSQFSENRIANLILPRLSLKFLAQEERFKSWGTTLEVIKERPILGWGLENLSIGFDKHFDPKKTPLGWWDRSHNTFLDATASAGIPGLLAYVGLFIVLFWQLLKFKNSNYADDSGFSRIMAHGMQALLIGYASANFFSINSFSTLLIFFLSVSYITHLVNKNSSQNTDNQQKSFNYIQNVPLNKKRWLFGIFVVVSSLFLFQYGLKPFFLNSKLNIATIMAGNDLCDQSVKKIDDINLPQKILGQYGTLEAMESLRLCIEKDMEKTTAYSKKGLDILERSLLAYPTSSRLWKLAGSISSTIAVGQEDISTKNEYLERSQHYLQKALSFSEKSQEIILSMAHVDILKKDCRSATERANQCLALDDSNSACYWTRAQTFICVRNFEAAEQDIQLAKELSFAAHLTPAIQQIINAYIAVENYEKVAEYYDFLVKKYDHYIPYKASLAEAYRLSGQYEKARETALEILKRVSETDREQARRDVGAFLKTLPYGYRELPPN